MSRADRNPWLAKMGSYLHDLIYTYNELSIAHHVCHILFMQNKLNCVFYHAYSFINTCMH